MARGRNAPDAPARVSIEVKRLREALAQVGAAVEGRNTIPVLSNVLIETGPGEITILGTDLDIWVSRHVAIAPELIEGPPFATTVCAATLKAVAAKLPAEGFAAMTVGGGKLHLECGRARFDLPTLPAEDLPRPAHVEWPVEYQMPALVLQAALARVQHAMSTEETRYYLNGIYLHGHGDGDGFRLRFVATDGHRLAVDERDMPADGEAMPPIIVPRKTVKLLIGLLDKVEGEVAVRVSDSKIEVETDEVRIVSKAVDGQFPDYTRVIPPEVAVAMKVERAALIAAVERVVTMSSDKTRVVKLELGSDVLTLTVASPERGLAVEEAPCDYAGPAVTIGFNSRYLLDALGQLTGETVEAHIADGAAPSLWRDGPDAWSRFVLMPVRV